MLSEREQALIRGQANIGNKMISSSQDILDHYNAAKKQPSVMPKPNLPTSSSPITAGMLKPKLPTSNADFSTLKNAFQQPNNGQATPLMTMASVAAKTTPTPTVPKPTTAISSTVSTAATKKPTTPAKPTPAPAKPPTTYGGFQDIRDLDAQRIYDAAKTGRKLSAPSPEKDALYAYYKSNPSAVPGGITGRDLQLIYEAAQSGRPLSAPTPEKQAVYNAFVGQKKQAEGTQDVDINKYRTEAATIDDIAKKYGFDYSMDYAKRQAEAEFQAKKNALNSQGRQNDSSHQENMKAIDNNLMNEADSLDRNYFQKYMQQAQMQTNSGLNGGIAADQDLRMAMSRQAEMGASYRDANLGRMQENNRYTNTKQDLLANMGQAELEKVTRAESLYNERLKQGFDQAMALSEYNQSVNEAMMDAALKQRDQNIQQSQFRDQLNLDKYKAQQDAANQAGNLKVSQGQLQLGKDQLALAKQQYLSENARANKKESFDEWLARKQLDLSITQNNQDVNLKRSQNKLDWANYGLSVQQAKQQKSQYWNDFNNMSESEKQEMAWKMYQAQVDGSLAGLAGGSSGGGSGALNSAKAINTGGVGGYTNLYKTKRDAAKSPGFKAFNSQLDQVMKKMNVNPSWKPYLTELFGRESTWNSGIHNPKSSARGYAQFLDSTKNDYLKKYKIDYDASPINQLILGIHYVQDRYGDPVKALQFWDKNNWY